MNAMQMALLAIVCCSLFQIDASRLYHSIRGQAVIKLYVIYNVLEIADRLCCSFGQDILDSLFHSCYAGPEVLDQTSPSQNASLVEHMERIRKEEGWIAKTLRILPYALLALIYTFIHALIQFYQLITLNVSLNSHNNALLTLLVSNQFVEIKQSVFKKFEKENLFQVSCSDVVERVQIGLWLVLVGIWNFSELSAGMDDDEAGAGQFGGTRMTLVESMGAYAWDLIENLWKMDMNQLPSLLASIANSFPSPYSIFSIGLDVETFWPQTSSFSALGLQYWELLKPVIIPLTIVFGSEMLVDWIKHAFITKFNQIRPRVYGVYLDLLCRDYVRLQKEYELEMMATADKGYGESGDGGNVRVRMDGSVIVAKRIGFANLPLACLIIRILGQSIYVQSFFTCHPPHHSNSSNEWIQTMECWTTIGFGMSLLFAILCVFKVALGIWIYRVSLARVQNSVLASSVPSVRASMDMLAQSQNNPSITSRDKNPVETTAAELRPKQVMPKPPFHPGHSPVLTASAMYQKRLSMPELGGTPGHRGDRADFSDFEESSPELQPALLPQLAPGAASRLQTLIERSREASPTPPPVEPVRTLGGSGRLNLGPADPTAVASGRKVTRFRSVPSTPLKHGGSGDDPDERDAPGRPTLVQPTIRPARELGASSESVDSSQAQSQDVIAVPKQPRNDGDGKQKDHETILKEEEDALWKDVKIKGEKVVLDNIDRSIT